MERLTTKHFLLVFGILVIGGIATSYASVHTVTTPNFEEYQHQHETIAILLFYVTVDYSLVNPNVSAALKEDVATRQETAYRKALYNQLLLGQQAGLFTVNFKTLTTRLRC